MKGHEQQKVHVKRLRLFKDFSDITNIAEQHETELDIARREIDALSNEIQSLQARKQLLETNTDDSNSDKDNGKDEVMDIINANVMNVSVGVCCVYLHEDIKFQS